MFQNGETLSANDNPDDATLDIFLDVVDIISSFLVLDHQSLKNIPKASTSIVLTIDLDTTSRYMLPNRSNHSKSPNRYSPKTCEKQFKYLITNYVSTYRLSKTLETSVYNTSLVDISSNMQAALMDPNCI